MLFEAAARAATTTSPNDDTQWPKNKWRVTFDNNNSNLLQRAFVKNLKCAVCTSMMKKCFRWPLKIVKDYCLRSSV